MTTELKIKAEYQEVYKTHNFDLSSPIVVCKYFKDYKCKNCSCTLIQAAGDLGYYISDYGYPGFQDKYRNSTCNQILMENILS